MADNIKNSKSEVLATRVVVYRVFGIDKDMAIASMQELVNRRENGDQFDYESFIENEVKAIPKPKKLNLSGIIGSMRKGVK